MLAWLLILTILYGLYRHRTPADALEMAHRKWFTLLGGLAVAQGAIGYLQYALGVPVGLVAVHITGSVLLWTAVSWYALWCSDAERQPGLTEPEPKASVAEVIP